MSKILSHAVVAQDTLISISQSIEPIIGSSMYRANLLTCAE